MIRQRVVVGIAAAILAVMPTGARAEEAELEGSEQQGESVERRLAEAREQIAELLRRIEGLEAAEGDRRAAAEQDELEALRREAESLALAPETEQERAAAALPADQTFTSGARSLQALNPEISFAVDAGARVVMRGGEPGSVVGLDRHDHTATAGVGDHAHADTGAGTGFFFRHLGIHFETDLDPFSFTKVSVGVSPSGAHLGEGYVTWARIAPGLQLTLGQFRQQFGVINRWHVPSLDQFDHPLALTEVLGAGGLVQPGVSLDWLIPTPWHRSSHTLVLQLTQPTNGHLFSGELIEVPTVLARLQSYFDLTDSLYLQLGITGMWGMYTSEERDVVGEPVAAHDSRGNPIVLYDEAGNEIGPLMVAPAPVHLEEHRGDSWLAGADLTLSWSPLSRERYHHVTWRSELYLASQQRREGRIQAIGAYSYLDAGISEAWGIGLRGDVTQPFELDNGGELRWMVSAYLNWWQSEWVRLRLQYSHGDGTDVPMEDRLILQIVFAAGPHKHERY